MAAIVRRGKPAASLEARAEEERARQRPSGGDRQAPAGGTSDDQRTYDQAFDD